MKIDRERSYAYGRQELDANLMDAAKPVAAGTSLKKCARTAGLRCRCRRAFVEGGGAGWGR